MACNPRRTSAGPHTTDRPSTRIKRDSADNGERQFAVTKLEAQMPKDSFTYDQVQTEIEYNHESQAKEAAGDELKKTLCSECHSAAQLQHTKRSSNGKISLPIIRSMRVPACMIRRWHDSLSSKLTDITNTDTMEPPVTTMTLKELDLHSIQNNLNLRIDICHDLDLFFQPISGRKGDEKRSESRKYWSALAAEFEVYLHDTQSDCPECRQMKGRNTAIFEARLPLFFDNLREIVQMLVPDLDHEEVADHLDTDLLMQQVRVGALDAIRISTWLQSLLTSHCAPMRDSTAEAVTNQIRVGTETGDMDVFVEGLETLFGLLEAMKLDIANHQIRSFRYHLIDETIDFQRACFSKAIETNQIDITKSRRWYRMQCFNHRFECGFEHAGEGAQRFEAFIHGLVHLCNPEERKVPLTLQYDHQRISRLREDLQDHIQMNLCLAVFNQRVQQIVGSHCDPSAMHNELKQRIISLTEDDDGHGGAISEYLDAIGIEITRAAFSISSTHERSKSPLSNFDFSHTVKILHSVFQDEDERQTVTKDFLASLEARTMQYTEQFNTMTALEIANAQRQWTNVRANKDILLADWDEIARKIAHIGVIHWRVWADLCYCETEQPSKDCELDLQITTGHYYQGSIDEFPGRQLPISSASEEHALGLDRVQAFEKAAAAMPKMEVIILCQDSGFAEDIESVSVHDADIDLDQELDGADGFSSDTGQTQSSKKRLTGLK